MTTPTTKLTLSARPHDLGSRWGSAPDLTRPVVLRLLDSKRRVKEQAEATRSVTIVRQLRVQRGTYPPAA